MFSMTTMSYVILGVFGGFSIIKILAERKLAFVTLMLNILLGGTLYVILNICKIDIPFNIISGSCITILGVPGVLLLVVLKFVTKII